MRPITIALIILFFILLLNKPTYVQFRGAKSNWKWHLARMPWILAVWVVMNSNEDVQVEFTKLKYWKMEE